MGFISTILFQFIRERKPFGVAVFVVFCLIFLGFVASPHRVGRAKQGVFGGPVSQTKAANANSFAILGDSETLPISRGHLTGFTDHGGLIYGSLMENAALVAGPVPGGGGASPGQGAVFAYRVKSGDTLSAIAREFGTSVETIASLNPGIRARSLKINEELFVLPVAGALYEVREGDTLETIAASFQITAAQLKEFNQIGGVLLPGASLVIPGATPGKYAAANNPRDLKNATEYFREPAEGFNWGRLHKENAVDISNACGTTVLAAADGLITDAVADPWNFGYGSMVTIEHPNDTKTRYAHLRSISVSVGDYVRQGRQIGTMGDTGETTGCHLHFEVLGAQNPFAR